MEEMTDSKEDGEGWKCLAYEHPPRFGSHALHWAPPAASQLGVLRRLKMSREDSLSSQDVPVRGTPGSCRPAEGPAMPLAAHFMFQIGVFSQRVQ